jgi:hypothetical protein
LSESLSGPEQRLKKMVETKQFWEDQTHYKGTFIIDKETPNGTVRELSTTSRFYAVSTERLIELMREAGFQDCRRIDKTIYQPILTGRKGA